MTETDVQADLAAWLLACVQADLDEADRWEHYNPDEGGYYSCPATRSEPYGDLEFGEENCDCGLAKRRARVLTDCDATRRIIQMYRNALAAVQAGSFSARNRTADETAVELLSEVLREMAVVYKDRPGYVASWAPDGR